MANTLSNNGITTGQTIEALQVSQSVDAFTGAKAYDITISGSLTLTGSLFTTGSVRFKNVAQNTTTSGFGAVLIDSNGVLYSGSSSVGAQGATGAQGSPGNNGNNGNNGAQGAQGAAGNNGNNGNTGAQGAQGATGPVGGTSGQVLYNSGGTATSSGNMTFDGTTLTVAALTESSALKYKQDILALSASLENLKKIQGVSFVRKGEQGRQLGFIAEDIFKVYPELVKVENGEVDSVYYQRVTAVLVEALKELTEKVEQQDLMISSLIVRVTRLEAK